MKTEDLINLLKTTQVVQKDGTVKTKIIDCLENYVTYFENSEYWQGKLSSSHRVKGSKTYVSFMYDGNMFTMSNLDPVVLEALVQIETDTKSLKNKAHIKNALSIICNKNKTETNDNEDNNVSMNVAASYSSEFSDIEALLDEIDNDETIVDKDDWAIYREWKNNESIKNYNKDGEVTGISDCYDNLVQWLEHYPPLKGNIKYNDKSDRIDFNGDIIKDNDVHTILKYCNKHFIRKYSNVKGMFEAIKGCANMHHYNPVKTYLESLTYDDSQDWFEYLIKNVLNAEMWDEYGDLYLAEFRKWMTACIKRIYNPGAKFDNILVLVSKNQGTGKSTVWERLFNIKGENFSKIVDASQDIPNGDRFIQQCAAKICINFDEIAMKSKNVNKIKTMLTQQSDEWHTLYSVADAPRDRDYLFVGTTNNTDFLKDYTSMFERRWWIIKVTEDSKNGIYINKMFDDEELNLQDNIWAQAKHIYDNNEEAELYITQGSELGLKLESLQRGYKASNNEYYDEIVNIMQMDWGFFDDKKTVNVESLILQYRHGDTLDYCKRRNDEIRELEKKDGYVMRAEDIKYTHYGQIDRWPVSILYTLLDKLGIKYTKQSLTNELEYSNEFERKYARCKMNNNNNCLAWCRTEYTPVNKFNDTNNNESEGSNKIPF